MHLSICVIGLLVGVVHAYTPFKTSRYFKSYAAFEQTQTQTQSSSQLHATERNAFGSKLAPDFTEAELSEMFKEFNITNFDINKDPELEKWAPSKEFFERFGFQNNTERYKRKTSDVKADFYNSYRTPILPQYKTFLADLIAMTFIQSIDSRYEYDALHAFGICTQYYTIMKGYALQDEIDLIFNAMMKSCGFDPVKLRDDAKRVLSMVKDQGLTEDSLLNSKEGELAEIFNKVRTNRFFKYSDAWGVGLGRVMEIIGVEPKEESFVRVAASLKWVFTPRLLSTWDEFSTDQIRLQGVEAMQKQLLIREKKRAAARLEKKAADFADKKKALLELNEAIEERRRIVIDEQKALKKKYEPEAYERILLEEQAAAANK